MLTGLLLSLVLFIPHTYNTIATNNCYQVYHRILIANHITNAPPLIIDDNSSNNAYQNGSEIHINIGLLANAHNSDEIALVIGHELGHYMLHHQSSTHRNEYMADKYGAKYMQHAGYNKCHGAQWLARLHHGSSNTHPASDARVKALGC